MIERSEFRVDEPNQYYGANYVPKPHTQTKRVLLTPNDSQTNSVWFVNAKHHSQTNAYFSANKKRTYQTNTVCFTYT